MNSALKSLENSPSYNIFQENANFGNMIYSLDDSLVSLSKNKYELSFPSTTTLGSAVNFDLLRVGILQGIILKLRLTGFTASSTEGSESIGAVGGFVNCIDEIKISSHHKTLLTLNASNIQHRYAKLPSGVRAQVETACQYTGIIPNDHDDDPNSASYGTIGGAIGYFGHANSRTEATGYVYIPFSIFSDLRNMASWNMEFLENLQLNVKLATGTNIVEQAAAPALDATNSKVIVSYYDMRPEDMKKFEQENYKIENGNLNLVLKDYYNESKPSTVTINGTGNTKEERVKTFNVPIQCRNLITSIYVRVRNDTKQYGLEGVRVRSIGLYLDGREFVKYEGDELNLISGVDGGVTIAKNSRRSASESGLSSAPSAFDEDEHFYELKFNQNESNAFSGAISARSTANPKLLVEVMASNNAAETYSCTVCCEHISLLSISQLDGRVNVSQNL